MANANNYIIVIFYIFFVTVGLIFFLNITLRFIGRLEKVNVFLIFLIIFVSALYVYSVINVNSNYADNRNAQRSTDIEIISNAVREFLTEKGNNTKELGFIPFCPEEKFIGSAAGEVNLYAKLKDITLPYLPVDPLKGNESSSGYSICLTSSQRVVISAPYAENEKVITVKK